MNNLSINNRRYIGSKTKLLPYIMDAAYTSVGSNDFSFADLFGGTGVVAYEFAKQGNPAIVNDILLSNVIAYTAWMGEGEVHTDKLNSVFDYLNTIRYEDINENYFSTIYGGKYFSCNDAKKIGFIRDYLEQIKPQLSYREYCILLTSLLYTTDKIANTVGHFESFLNREPQDTRFVLPQLALRPTASAQIFNEDANELAKRIQADIVYLDPPYNARQYINFYHVLENLARWNKPTEFEGNSMKFKRDNLKSGYSRSVAPMLFQDLVSSLQCRVIIVSYNNTYNARSGASNNKIQEEEIMRILSARGEASKIDIDYRSFNAGKTDMPNHKEYLFVCRVK